MGARCDSALERPFDVSRRLIFEIGRCSRLAKPAPCPSLKQQVASDETPLTLYQTVYKKKLD